MFTRSVGKIFSLLFSHTASFVHLFQASENKYALLSEILLSVESMVENFTLISICVSAFTSQCDFFFFFQFVIHSSS